MSHFETKTLETLERIAAALEHLAGGNAPAVKAEAPAAYEAAVQALKDLPDDLPPPEAPKGKPPTKEEVVAALNAYSRVHGVGPAKKVLQSYGEALGAVPVEKYAELMALLAVTK
jgi:hypothetical protein